MPRAADPVSTWHSMAARTAARPPRASFSRVAFHAASTSAAELEAKVDTIAADLRGDIKALGTRLEALGGQLKFGLGLLVVMLAVVMGMIGVLHAGA